MTAVILFLAAISGFFIGFCLGVIKKNERISIKPEIKDSRMEKISQEYENFLNYDGSEQI